ncbi:leucine-rich repeat protein [Enterococcus faecium]|uniref:leucine-rich repeat protein n=1 Tax=Enterococcus faecium TaxID=1352 RepID=UPI00145B3558|nr:leucine-rich repeat protein [Enterococcus faecium]QMX56553.1 leucine-rich repeat protein [Enterococcus faecium]QOJ75709.1 leucine-rich repeat protein [Enterococcus faecium]QTQ92113.1 leucine-rich repeat protein [Enterococcus faecium]HCR2865852.1 leucine-rich repeat protein [Enterococcus faecium]
MSEDKNKKLKNWIKVAMSLYLLAFVVGIGLNVNQKISKADLLDATITSTTSTTSSSEAILDKTSTSTSESKTEVTTAETTVNTTESTTQSEKQTVESSKAQEVTTETTVESSKAPEVRKTEISETTQSANKSVKQEINTKALEDVLETKYNASKFEEDHSKECALDAEMYNDNFCEGFYKLIAKTAQEKALRAYMLDYHVFDYFGVNSATNTLNANVTAYLSDGSVATSTDTAIYREFNGKKTKLLDLSNNPNYYYFENGLYISNKGIISGTTISKSTKTLTIPNKISGITVKGIDSAVFRDYNFTSVSLPDSVEIIGYEQFYNSTFKTFKKPKNLKYTAHNMFNPEIKVTIN